MRGDQKLADWATVGAEVWVQLDSYSDIPRYRKGTITRVTKTSAFVKLVEGTTEYRFTGVDETYMSWTERNAGGKPETFMNEYGSRGDIYGWRGRKHLYAADSKVVANNIERSRVMELRQRAIKAADQFSRGRMADKSQYTLGKEAVAALEAWLAAVPEDEQ